MELRPSAGGGVPFAGPPLFAPGATPDSRFAFGENWRRFLRIVDDERIREAEAALREMLGVDDLVGRRFLDIGCGSGLSSLAARRLGAAVVSFDIDELSVASTVELQRRYFPNSPLWTVQRGSVLDADYMRGLGSFDVVYSWGVLHHTGRMWEALDKAILPVTSDGLLFVAVYNDTGTQARRWRWIKRTYNRLPRLAQPPFVLAVTAPAEIKAMWRTVSAGRPWDYVLRWTAARERGMDHWRDLVDWVGGYPYEFARPEEVFGYCRDRGFTLRAMKCGCVGLGCNEFVFESDPRRRTRGQSAATRNTSAADIQPARGLPS